MREWPAEEVRSSSGTVGSRGQEVGGGEPVSQAPSGKRTGAGGSRVVLEDTEGWGHGCLCLSLLCFLTQPYLPVPLALTICPFLFPSDPAGSSALSPHHQGIKG